MEVPGPERIVEKIRIKREIVEVPVEVIVEKIIKQKTPAPIVEIVQCPG